MRRDNFTFTPKLKLFMAGNHRPSIRNVDNALKRRFQLIPFSVTIPADERDPSLPDKLRAEAPGILAWAIRGCLSWQRDGLQPPAVVTTASEQYLTDEDVFGRWLDECAERRAGAVALSADLWNSFRLWAANNGEHIGTQKRTSQALQARGFESFKDTTGRMAFRGLRVKATVGWVTVS
jgi:putative DNA primase/helicase